MDVPNVGEVGHAAASSGSIASNCSALGIEERPEATIPAPLREKNARICIIEVIVVQILHHEQGLAVILMRRHHQLVVHWEGRVFEGGHQQVGAEIVAHVVQVRHVQAWNTLDAANEPIEGPFASRLLL